MRRATFVPDKGRKPIQKTIVIPCPAQRRNPLLIVSFNSVNASSLLLVLEIDDGQKFTTIFLPPLYTLSARYYVIREANSELTMLTKNQSRTKTMHQFLLFSPSTRVLLSLVLLLLLWQEIIRSFFPSSEGAKNVTTSNLVVTGKHPSDEAHLFAALKILPVKRRYHQRDSWTRVVVPDDLSV
jgi:hypothetical protein